MAAHAVLSLLALVFITALMRAADFSWRTTFAVILGLLAATAALTSATLL